MRMTRRELLAMGMALMLAGCSQKEESQPKPEATEPKEQEVAEPDTNESIDFDGSGLDEAGDFDFYIKTAGGTSEDGNVPEVVYKQGTMGTQVGVHVEGGDGTPCSIYVDGHKRGMMNAGHADKFVTLEASDLTEGAHIVEIASEDEGVTIYRKAQYEIVLDE